MSTDFFDRDCLVIGEVAQSHDGSLGMAHAFIDAIADAGASAVKFQTHFADEESTPDEPWRIKFSKQDASRFDYWKRMEFAPEHWQGLKDHAEERGLMFLSSPFSLKAVELLDRMDMQAWKVASGEVFNLILMDAMLATGRPIIASTGMSSWQDIDQLVERLQQSQNPYALLQCTTAYPCPAEKVGLNVMQEYAQRYNCPAGLSDHSASIYPGLAAATLGASIIEVHVTLSPAMFGPDVPASLTLPELKQLVDGVAIIQTMLANPVDKNQSADDTRELRRIFGRSLVASEDLVAGTILSRNNLAAKKPAGGWSVEDIDTLNGRRLKHSVEQNHFIDEEDLES